MYMSNLFITALAAASTAEACVYANAGGEALPADAIHSMLKRTVDDIQQEAPSTLASSKRALATILGSVNGLVSGFLGGGNQDTATCPPVWSEISTALTAQFLADGQCTDAARAAIRASFHDCFNGACDGSLILANECANSENVGIQRLCGNLENLATQKQVGVADIIQFAAAHAIKTCPGGPTVPVKVGRKDSSDANALGVLPLGSARAGDLIRLFGSKGFSPIDLAALIGAHTTAKQRTTDPAKANTALDSTVGVWDNKYFAETKKGQAPFTLPSDRSIAQNPLTALSFSSFAVNKGAWDVAFVAAMQKMSMLGVDSDGLVDCTSALPGGSAKREIRNSNVFDRLKW